MTETKTTYEQYCTYQNKNIVIEVIMFEDGRRQTRCTNYTCPNNNKKCKNKLNNLFYLLTD